MTDLVQPDRLAKARAMRDAGQDPFPARGVAATPIETIVARAGTSEQPGPAVGERVTVAGRLAMPRDFGKLIFAPLADRTGKLQIGLRRDSLGEWWPQRKWLDAGDLVGVTGEVGFTQKGELTVWASEVKLLAAGEVARLGRRRSALPAALRRSVGHRRRAADLRQAQQDRQRGAALPRSARLLGGRNADAAPDLRRRDGAPVRDAPQRARRGFLPAHRA
jgi:lysyl-tRNA synthetase class 2